MGCRGPSTFGSASKPVGSVHSREYDALTSLLRELREAAGVSQEELSRRMGRPISYFGKVELGTRRLDVVELLQVADALSLDVVQVVAELKRRVVDGG